MLNRCMNKLVLCTLLYSGIVEGNQHMYFFFQKLEFY